uniref:Uncharacterized protein n=1 Tax=Fagus sylvatica TaxID=28930 RepID=A0A2N9I5U3_FAGSY
MGNQVAMACRVARQGATCECDGLVQLGAEMGGEGLAQRVEARRSNHSLKRSLLGYPRMSCNVAEAIARNEGKNIVEAIIRDEGSGVSLGLDIDVFLSFSKYVYAVAFVEQKIKSTS